LNAYAERFVLSIKSECLDRIVPLGERHLRRAIVEYLAHYHGERNHQGLGNVLLRGSPDSANENGRAQRRERLGGLLNFYNRNRGLIGARSDFGHDGDLGWALWMVARATPSRLFSTMAPWVTLGFSSKRR